MIRRMGSLAILALLSACATDGPAAKPSVTGPASAPTAEFRTSDFAWSTAPGKARIQGQLDYKAGGVAYGCAEAGVLLTPQTPWTYSRMKVLYLSADRAILPAKDVRGRTPPGRSGDYSAFVRRAACDSAGRFAFGNLPDGNWFVITVAKPVAPGTGQEVAIMRRVATKSGKQTDVRL